MTGHDEQRAVAADGSREPAERGFGRRPRERVGLQPDDTRRDSFAERYGVLPPTLEELLDRDQVRDSEHTRLIVSPSGVETGETAYFSNFDPKPFRVEHVVASGSLPPGFPWTIIDGRAYWDGGSTDNTPLKPVIDNLHGGARSHLEAAAARIFGPGSNVLVDVTRYLAADIPTR